MAHLLKNGSSIFKVGSHIFRVRDAYTYLNNVGVYVSANMGRILWEATTNKIYIPNPSLNTISILSGVDFSSLATITGLTNPSSVDINITNNLMCVQLGGGNVALLNATTYTVISIITSGLNTDGRAISIDPVAANNRAISVSLNNFFYIINTSTAAVIGSVSVVQPFGVTFDPSLPQFYILTLGGQIKTYSTVDYSLLATSTAFLGTATQMVIDPVMANNRFLCINRDEGTVQSINRTTMGNNGLLAGAQSSGQSYGIAVDPVAANNRFIITDNNTGKLVVITQIAS